MKLPWFKQVGVVFVPTSIIGWLILTGSITLSIYLYIDVAARTHSLGDTLMSFVAYQFIGLVVYTSIAYFSSRSSLK